MVVRCDQNDLKRAIGALGRIDQSGHVRSAAGNENGDFGFLSHHYSRESGNPFPGLASGMGFRRSAIMCGAPRRAGAPAIGAAAHGAALFPRSAEHTSELQSLMRISYAVFCLKKKTQ